MYGADPNESSLVRAEGQLAVTAHKLQEQLKQREFHLAELIDEVVYADGRCEESLQGSLALQHGAAQLERAFQQLLRFHVVLSEDVILPSLLDTVQRRMNGATLLDDETRRTLRQISAAPHAVARPTQQLIDKVLATDAHALDSGAGDTVDGNGEPPGRNHKLEQAIVLGGQLCRHQRDLLGGLEKVHECLAAAVTGDDSIDGIPWSPTRAASTDAVMTINREMRRRSSPSRSPADGAAIAELRDQLADTRAERDRLLSQLQAQAKSDTVVASLLTDKRQLENELLYAQRRTLEEQGRGRDLRQRVLELEAAVDRLRRAGSQGLVTGEEELRRLSRGADVARASLEGEVERLRAENRALVDAGERLMLNSPSGEVSAKRKAAKLEGVVAALKTDLHIMENRLAVIQDQRGAERERIVAQFEAEKQRLRRERDECQSLIDQMADELNLLSRHDGAMRGATSIGLL